MSNNKLLIGVIAVLLTLTFTPVARAQMCGDFNGDMMASIPDFIAGLNYLYLDGDPPADYDFADCDGHEIYTINDWAVLVRMLFVLGAPAQCPPTNSPLGGTTNGNIFLHTFETSFPADEYFPQGEDEFAVHFHLTTDTELTVASLAFNIRVGGQIPTIDSVTLPEGSNTTFQYVSKVDHTDGKVSIGLISMQPAHNIPPGTYEYGYVHLTMPSLPLVWRPIEIEWDSLSPSQTEGYSHYPFAVGDDDGEHWTPTIARFPCLGAGRGDADYNGSEIVDISDLVYLVDYMFTGGGPPKCFEEVDLEVNLQLDIGDLVYLVDYMFNDGPPPPPCPDEAP